jgi:thiol-disulfide isomerase/thioredoxin
MKRRHALYAIAALTLFLAAPSFAATPDTMQGFDQAVAAGGPVLVHITAGWCTECQLQKPVVARLLATPDFKDMKEFKVDFDAQKDVLKRLHVQSQSTLVVYKGGKEVDRMTGDTDPTVIEAVMRKGL